MKKNIIRRRVLIGVVLVLLVAGVFIWRYLTPYKPEARAETALISAGGVTVEQNDNWISFDPSVVLGTAVIFIREHWSRRKHMRRWPVKLPQPVTRSTLPECRLIWL